MKVRTKSMTRRIVFLTTVMVVWAGVIGGQLYKLHVVQSAELKDKAVRQQQKVFQITPRRGVIYDRNGYELAVSIKVDSAFAVPTSVQDARDTAEVLSPITGIAVSDLLARLQSERSFVWIKRKLTAAESAAIQEANLPGIAFLQEDRRFYPQGEAAAHVLGYVNIDEEGQGGLELKYDDSVRGTPGRVVIQTDARRRDFHRVEEPPTPGANLVTTVDQNVQYVVEKELRAAVERTHPVGMSIIAMDPRDGEILAMANYPQFNPNETPRKGEERARLNRAVGQVFEPGSTFKIVTATAALEEHLTRLDEVIDCQMGAIYLFGHRIRDHKPFGLLTVKQIMQNSSDVGMIKLGMRLGEARFANHIFKLGFGRQTGIDLPGEEVGLTKPASRWSKISVGAISMGQEIGVTPLQILAVTSAVANGGILYKPYVVRRVEHPVEGLLSEAEPQGQRVMTPETAEKLREMLTAVVSDGTAKAARLAGYTAAGKTGTAQKIINGRYSQTKHVASFVGYAPATNPALALIVVMDEPSGLYHGGEVAAPVFKSVAEQVLRYLAVPSDSPLTGPLYTQKHIPKQPTVPAESSANPDAILGDWKLVAASLVEDESSVESSSSSRPNYSLVELPVPDFQGKSLRQVTEECLKLGLRLRATGSGTAVEQFPIAGAVARYGARVMVRFSAVSNGSR